jgi:hypothetical protein
MAGRNKREAADYFSHDSDASTDEKIVYLESLFGHKGYAVYFKFLERMARSDGFELEWNDIKKAIYAAEFNISVTEIDLIVTECCRKEIKAFQIDDGKLFSVGLKKRMQPLIDKRNYNRSKYKEKKAASISVTEMTQSKVKESKVKNKENTSFEKNEGQNEGQNEEDFYLTKNKKKLFGKHLKTFLQFWDAFDYKFGKAEAADAWLAIPDLTQNIVNTIISAAKTEAQNRPTLKANGSTPKMGQGWLSGRRWEDETEQPPKKYEPTLAEILS